MVRHSVPTAVIIRLAVVSLAAALLTVSCLTGCSSVHREQTVEVSYRFTARDIPANAERIHAWVPLPLSDRWQHLEHFRVDGNLPYRILNEPEYGNRFLLFDLSGAEPGEGAEVVVAVTFRVNRKSYRALGAPGVGESTPQETLARFLAPDRLVPVGGRVAEEARRVAGEVKDPLVQARRLYDHIVATVTYDKSGEGWGRGDALYACDVRAGNCTDFHSLFIAEARALGIPARFIMGLPLPEGASQGTIEGYHCWAEFYLQDRGWVPVDASEASKFPQRKETFFGGLDANRVAFTVGRDIHIPQSSAGPLNYVIYPHVEVDGRPHEKVETRFSFRDYKAR
ncbi:MAG: transglutaminase-like domain-containing protein [Candidatus Zixiibacteriota bacterium]